MRKIICGLLAAGLLIGFLSFSKKTQAKQATEKAQYYWYKLRPGGDPGYYMDYDRVWEMPCGGPWGPVCGVYAEPYWLDDYYPNLSQVLFYVYPEN
jgi:hypothetical protein